MSGISNKETPSKTSVLFLLTYISLPKDTSQYHPAWNPPSSEEPLLSINYTNICFYLFALDLKIHRNNVLTQFKQIPSRESRILLKRKPSLRSPFLASHATKSQGFQTGSCWLPQYSPESRQTNICIRVCGRQRCILTLTPLSTCNIRQFWR